MQGKPRKYKRPILFPLNSVNHSAPSGPVAINSGSLAAAGVGNSVITKPAVMRPIVLPAGPLSVNHIAPSGPIAMPSG